MASNYKVNLAFEEVDGAYQYLLEMQDEYFKTAVTEYPELQPRMEELKQTLSSILNEYSDMLVYTHATFNND